QEAQQHHSEGSQALQRIKNSSQAVQQNSAIRTAAMVCEIEQVRLCDRAASVRAHSSARASTQICEIDEVAQWCFVRAHGLSCAIAQLRGGV
ncbi:hypothetical protein SOVF_191720, partial [Spinacia oleracea]